jgi:hypothetical protein
MIDESTLHQTLRWIHILFGFVGLAVFWAPVFAKKGGRLHIRAGKIFVICAYVVGVSAVFSCAWALLDPRSFAGLSATLRAERVVEISSDVRFFFAFLGVLGLLLVNAVEGGIPVLRTRGNPDRLDSWRLRAVHVGLGAASAALLACGVWQLAQGGGTRYWIWVGIGALVLGDARGAWKHMKNPLPTPMAWWYRHMECMLGAGIAFHTAFAVFGASRLMGVQLEGGMALVPWVLPSLIGVPAITIWTRHYKRKFGEMSQPRRGPVPAGVQ